jgi:hypothetical protein
MGSVRDSTLVASSQLVTIQNQLRAPQTFLEQNNPEFFSGLFSPSPALVPSPSPSLN